MKARRSTELVEKKDFYKELFSLAIPIGMQNLLVALIGASDALMLGRLTQDAVSAVSLANQIAFIMSLFSGAVVGGGGALIAQYWGKGDWTMVKNLFCMLIKWAFGISFVFFALAMFAPELLMRIYTPDTALIKIGASYLRAVSLSYLFTGVTPVSYTHLRDSFEDSIHQSINAALECTQHLKPSHTMFFCTIKNLLQIWNKIIW